jgi:tRNA pseudouridine synthase 10
VKEGYNILNQEEIEFLKNNPCCRYCSYRIVQPGLSFTEFDEDALLQHQIKLANDTSCRICHGLMLKSITSLEKMAKRLEKVEFQTFLVGCRVNQKQLNLDTFVLKKNIPIMSIKQFMVSTGTELITKRFSKINENNNPDVTVLLEIKTNPRFRLDLRSIYILGKYQKLERGIPQTKWPCSVCKGKKCKECDFTGQQYPFTVETIVAQPFIEASKALSSSFHGAGREDIDALMLGEGRPFVLELKQPLIRAIDIDVLLSDVNKSSKVKINNLTITNKQTIAYIKNTSPDSQKTYIAKIQFKEKITKEELHNLKEIGKQKIQLSQRTPIRVSHRRADKIREKTIYAFNILEINVGEKILVLEIEAQGGAYIKEFISGDDGRTTPSLSDFLNQNVECVALDVMKVDDKGLFNIA